MVMRVIISIGIFKETITIRQTIMRMSYRRIPRIKIRVFHVTTSRVNGGIFSALKRIMTRYSTIISIRIRAFQLRIVFCIPIQGTRTGSGSATSGRQVNSCIPHFCTIARVRTNFQSGAGIAIKYKFNSRIILNRACRHIFIGLKHHDLIVRLHIFVHLFYPQIPCPQHATTSPSRSALFKNAPASVSAVSPGIPYFFSSA